MKLLNSYVSPFAARARLAIYAPDVAHAFAQQRERGGLAAHAAADDQRIKERLPVRARGGRHPVRGGEVELRELAACEGGKRVQGFERHYL